MPYSDRQFAPILDSSTKPPLASNPATRWSGSLSTNSIEEAYRDGGMVTAEINGILAEDFCADLVAPIEAAYETEKARILGVASHQSSVSS